LPQSTQLEIIPLGGLGEFGLNLMLYRFGDDCIVVDAGVMFPGPDLPGVDRVVPDLRFLDDCGTLHAVVLTHGHEDHIGAVAHLLARRDVPVHGPAHALGLLRARFREMDHAPRATFVPLPPDGEPLHFGPFVVETVASAHSIPQSKMIVLTTPVGTLLHTADFKLTGAGADSCAERLIELGRNGVLALLSDSTNADRPGSTPGESVVIEAIDGLLADREGRVLITAFASNVERVERLARLAQRHGRKLALAGRAMQSQVEIAESLGLVGFPAGLRVSPDRVMQLAPRNTMVIASGSQAEPLSAMARIAAGRHHEVEVEPGDLVIHSARVIPGNERNIGALIDQLLIKGADVVTQAEAAVHVSGHGAADDLAQLIEWVRPRYVIPIHGEYRHLSAHARLARARGIAPDSVLLARSGDRVTLTAERLAIEGSVPTGRMLVDAAGSAVPPGLVQERRQIAGDGIVVPVVTLDRETGTLTGNPSIVSRGFTASSNGQQTALMLEAERFVATLSPERGPDGRIDVRELEERIETELRRFLRRRTQRQPLIVPLIKEL